MKIYYPTDYSQEGDFKERKIIIDRDVSVEVNIYDTEIVISKEICYDVGGRNGYKDVEITLNKEDAIALIEFINQNLGNLK